MSSDGDDHFGPLFGSLVESTEANSSSTQPGEHDAAAMRTVVNSLIQQNLQSQQVLQQVIRLVTTQQQQLSLQHAQLQDVQSQLLRPPEADSRSDARWNLHDRSSASKQALSFSMSLSCEGDELESSLPKRLHRSTPVSGHSRKVDSEEARSVLIKGLPVDIDEDEVRKVCGSMGPIASVTVEGCSGIAIVKYETAHYAWNARQNLHNKLFRGQQLEVPGAEDDLSLPQRKQRSLESVPTLKDSDGRTRVFSGARSQDDFWQPTGTETSLFVTRPPWLLESSNDSISRQTESLDSPRLDTSESKRKAKKDKKDTKQFTLDLHRVLGGADKRTSLMIRNIPNKYTRDQLVELINRNHQGKYDFFYLPVDAKSYGKCNLGYAFINFTNYTFIPPFYHEFHMSKIMQSEKICEISYARLQGKIPLMRQFQSQKTPRPVTFLATNSAGQGQPDEWTRSQHPL